jgi:putative transposase
VFAKSLRPGSRSEGSDFAAIADWTNPESHLVTLMCAEPGVSRSDYYAWRKAVPSKHQPQGEVLIAIIGHLHTEGRGNPGVRRVRAGLAAAVTGSGIN